MEAEVGIIFILSVVLSIMTPLHGQSGFLMMGALAVVLVLNIHRLINKRIALIIVIQTIIYFLFIMFTPNIMKDMGQLNISITMYTTMIVGTLCILEQKSDCCSIRKLYCLDSVCEVVWVLMMVELIKYAMKYSETWSFRLSTEADFWGIYHHVDFSVLTFLVCAILLKRRKYIESLILAGSAWFILPSRTLKMLLILCLIIYFLRNIIYNICNNSFLRHSIVWIFFLLVASFAFSYVWINYLGLFFSVVEGHEGLYDTSNLERFQTIIYAGKVIIKQNLILGGVDRGCIYSKIIKNLPYIVTNGPHNSYIAIILYYSVCFGGIYLFFISKVIDKYMSANLIPLVITYLLTACILHGMFEGPRGILFIAMLIIPFKPKKYAMRRRKH